MTAGDVRVELRVTGVVQGVGFRWATEREARRLGLRGYVQNEDDGSVTIGAEGRAATVARLVEWAGRGPRMARVDRVDVTRKPAANEFGEFGMRS